MPKEGLQEQILSDPSTYLFNAWQIARKASLAVDRRREALRAGHPRWRNWAHGYSAGQGYSHGPVQLPVFSKTFSLLFPILAGDAGRMKTDPSGSLHAGHGRFLDHHHVLGNSCRLRAAAGRGPGD